MIIGKRIDDWYSTKVQNSRKKFLKNFAFENSSQINDIENLINSCKNALLNIYFY